MKLNFKKLAVTTGVLATVAGSGLVASPAHAVPAAANPGAILNAVGSDTTYFMMNGLTAQYNVNGTVNTESPKDRIINTMPFVTAPFPAGNLVPAQGACASDVVYSATNLPPAGSSAGITALANSTDDCVDLARSSRGRKSTDSTSLEFYAYALDALSWAYFPGTHAPTNLTQQNLIDIYTCDPATGAPFVSDWSAVGGTAGAIKKYAPVTTSGTYSFFNSQILGGKTIDQNCDNAHKSTFGPEHDATVVASADKTGAILPFSYAQYYAASKFIITDLRNGTKLGAIDGLAPGSKTITEAATGTAGHFRGTRYVFNVVKTTSTNYDDAMRFAGVDNAGAGWICSGDKQAASLIKLYGFTPLKKGATGGGVTIQSVCRKEPAAL